MGNCKVTLQLQKVCSCCGAGDDIQLHHLYPKSQGCPDSLMVPLCFKCHRAAHGLTASINHSELTRQGLASAKARGVKLGGLRDTTMKRNEAVRVNAEERAKKIENVIAPLRRSGATLTQIAQALNAAAVPTARGGSWWPAQVQRALQRIENFCRDEG